MAQNRSISRNYHHRSITLVLIALICSLRLHHGFQRTLTPMKLTNKVLSIYPSGSTKKVVCAAIENAEMDQRLYGFVWKHLLSPPTMNKRQQAHVVQFELFMSRYMCENEEEFNAVVDMFEGDKFRKAFLFFWSAWLHICQEKNTLVEMSIWESTMSKVQGLLSKKVVDDLEFEWSFNQMEAAISSEFGLDMFEIQNLGDFL
mmetsp:Transcript_36360/g.47970  ORF Transcript_36360/g.47970 Transcript_36360/m.47970 type:complete len:202 (+) Transcript_36360:102-707(+)